MIVSKQHLKELIIIIPIIIIIIIIIVIIATVIMAIIILIGKHYSNFWHYRLLDGNDSWTRVILILLPVLGIYYYTIIRRALSYSWYTYQE